MPTVLVVEEENGYRTDLERILRRKGVRVLTAGDAEGVRAILREAEVDLAVLDIGHLGDLDGLRLAEQVARENDDVPLLVITGKGLHGRLQSRPLLGAVEFLERPGDLPRIEECIRRCAEI